MKTRSILAAAILAISGIGTTASADETFGFEMQIGGMRGHTLQLVIYRNNDVLAKAEFSSGNAAMVNVPYALAQRVTRFCVISDKDVAHFRDNDGGEFERTCDDFDGRTLPGEAQRGFKLVYTSTLYPS